MKLIKNKFYRVVLVLLLMCLFSLNLVACESDNSDEEKGNFSVYYLDKDRVRLESVQIDFKQNDTKNDINSIIEKMNNSSGKIDVVVAKPDKVKIIKTEFVNNIATVYFDESYNEMTKIDELLYRASLVLTLTQLKDVLYVGIIVDNQALVDSEGNLVGNMKADYFIDITGNNIHSFNKDDITLYFAKKDSEKLVEQVKKGTYPFNISLERYIVDSLIKGPNDDELLRTISSKVEVINVVTKSNICYVNFTDSFLTEPSPISPKITIYSLVNSLLELTHISKVQISVNGETKIKYNGISLEEPFDRNLDIIQ